MNSLNNMNPVMITVLSMSFFITEKSTDEVMVFCFLIPIGGNGRTYEAISDERGRGVSEEIADVGATGCDSDRLWNARNFSFLVFFGIPCCLVRMSVS